MVRPPCWRPSIQRIPNYPWTIDIDPATGGEPVKAKALIKIIKNLVNDVANVNHRNGFDELEDVKVTIFGWSH